MCETCFGGGMGPGLKWRPPVGMGTPHLQDIAPKAKTSSTSVHSPTFAELLEKRKLAAEKPLGVGATLAKKFMDRGMSALDARDALIGQDYSAKEAVAALAELGHKVEESMKPAVGKDNKDRNAKMQADRDGGMSLERLSEKYKLSLGTVATYTTSPKHHDDAPRLSARKRSVHSSGEANFDAILADLEAKKAKIQKAIEAILAVRELLEE
jgi:hypothetical protein